QLLRPSRGVTDRLAVARIDDAWRELDRALERADVVAERVGPTFGIEADRRGDPVQQMVAGDQHALAQEAEVPVCMARQFDDLPAGERAPLVEQVRVAGVPDEGRERMSLLDQLARA